jgi:hypothetical protein
MYKVVIFLKIKLLYLFLAAYFWKRPTNKFKKIFKRRIIEKIKNHP